MKKVLQISNIISLLIAIFVNYFVNAKQAGTPSISEISARYDTLLTPAGYAFGIWGLIYLGLIIFAVYQSISLFNKKYDNNYVSDIGWWFVLANLANAVWVVAFTNNQIGLSVLIIILLLFSLLKIVFNTNMERWDAPGSIIGFLWWPISLYFGWIVVATIVNIAAWLTSTGWDGAPLSPDSWAIIILIIAGIIFVYMTWNRNMREAANVGVWGIIAIGVKNWGENDLVAYSSIIVAIIIFISASAHGYKNRATAPFRKRTKQIESL